MYRSSGRPIETETQFLLGLAEENSFIKGVVGWVDLSAEDLGQQLSFLKKSII